MNLKKTQYGQALVEGVLALLVLASIWVAVAWLGHLQDMALSAQHASRHAAFSHTRNPEADTSHGIRAKYFQGPAHHWKDRSGSPILPSPLQQVQVHWTRTSTLAHAAQPGGHEAMAESLRTGWGLQDGGVVKASVHVISGSEARHYGDASVLGLEHFNSYPQLRRHTAILDSAGHASSDARAQKIVAQSALAWSDSAQASDAIGRKIDAAMAAVDAPWDRARPVFDWLSPWAGHVPAERLAYPAKEP